MGTDTGRPWLAAYPPGVPGDIDAGSLGTLVDMLAQSIETHRDAEAFESFGRSLTFGALGREARAFAAWLQARGLGKGDRVALMMPNVMAYPVTLVGALMAGCIVVNVNPLYTARELSEQLNDSGARILVVLESFAHTVEAAGPALSLEAVVVARAGDLIGLRGALVDLVARHFKRVVPAWSLPNAVSLRDALAQHAGEAPTDPGLTPSDIAFLQYTGGTTGRSKGAMLTHANLAANVAQCEAWLSGALGRAEGRPVMVTALPLYHIFALTGCCLLMMRMGVKSLLIANPRDLAGLVKTLSGARFTFFSGVNTLYNALSLHPDIGRVDFSRLVFSVSGGMATQSAVAERWRTLTGCPIVEGYGLSETSPVVSINRTDIEAFTGTIGYPMPSTWVAVRDGAGRDCPPGTSGELCVRGPQVMAGYWNSPDETARAFTADGYFRTGDVAVMQEDGAFRIVDRLKDMVLVSGFNVYPNEVEEIIARHPGVVEAAVVGMPDEMTGEAVVAYVVRRDPSLTQDAMRAHLRQSLTGYKVPRHIRFRDSLPKSPVGKVLRRTLREEAALVEAAGRQAEVV